MNKEVLIFLDIEALGVVPGLHSMISLGAISADVTGQELGRFEVNLHPLPDTQPSFDTLKWWEQFPEAFNYATGNQVKPELAMKRFSKWVRSFEGQPVCASSCAVLDLGFIHYYGAKLLGEDLFEGHSLDLPSFIAGATGNNVTQCQRKDWNQYLVENLHSHKAIEDAAQCLAVYRAILNKRTFKK